MNHDGIDCSKCSFGKFREDFFNQNCQKCDNKGYYKNPKKEEEFDNCRSNECDNEKVHLSIKINPYCLKSTTLAKQAITKNIKFLLVVFSLITIIHFFSITLKQYKINFKKKRQVKEIDDLLETEEREIFYVYLQGRNIYYDPWYLQLDHSKEFESFVSRREYFPIIRVF